MSIIYNPKQFYTEEEYNELKQCFNNLPYFAEKIIIYGKEKLKLYPKQKEILEEYQNNRFVINQSPRQFGKTLLSGAWRWELSCT